ncbi:MAG: HD domain-containing protein [bacterium]|nr:HD domain-containing protein [bacterium]
MSDSNEQKIVRFLFEMGTMRKLPRMHRQTLLTDDMSDNIATHSYRATLIGWFLAKMEKADPYKVVMMCLTHDMGEVRTGDHNWIHKKYVKIFDEEIKAEQLGTLPFGDLKEIADEYDKRESVEAIIAKEADLIDQLFLLREYVWQGNKEALIWLEGKPGEGGEKDKYLERFKTKSGKALAKIALSEDPSSWWDNLWTNKNR